MNSQTRFATANLSEFDRRLLALLHRHGYAFVPYATGGRLLQTAIPGFFSAHELPWNFSSLLQAVEHLIPTCGDDYFNEYSKTIQR